MPAAVAGIAMGVGAIWAAHENSNASQKASADQVAAANHAADLKAEADKASLDYQKQQAAVAQDNFIKAQQASYEQWAAREQRLAPFRSLGSGAMSTLGGLLGIQGAPQPGVPPPPQFTPSTPGTFGNANPFPTSSDKTAQQNTSQTTFNTGAASIQNQINGLPQAAGAPPTGAPPNPGGPGIDTSQYARPVGGQSLGSLVSPQGQNMNGPIGQTILMRAPDGTQRAVPVADVPHYEQLGAVRVQ